MSHVHFRCRCRLPKQLRDRFLSEYNQRIRYLTDSSGDPFKHALYKLIGRTEISRRNVPGVTNTTEDWLWVQLMLVRESSGSGGGDSAAANEPGFDKFTLRDLAKVLVKFGENHFDPKGQRPLLYFQVLLLSGQFERVSLKAASAEKVRIRLAIKTDIVRDLILLPRPSHSSMATRSTRPTLCTLASRSPIMASCACRRGTRLRMSTFVRASPPRPVLRVRSADTIKPCSHGLFERDPALRGRLR